MSNPADEFQNIYGSLRNILRALLLLFISGIFYFINIKPSKEYYQSGELYARSDGPFIFDGGGRCGGKKCGRWIYFYQNGQKQKEGSLHLNKKLGAWIFYYENGQKKAEGFYEDDDKIGEWKYWNEDGSLK